MRYVVNDYGWVKELCMKWESKKKSGISTHASVGVTCNLPIINYCLESPELNSHNLYI